MRRHLLLISIVIGILLLGIIIPGFAGTCWGEPAIQTPATENPYVEPGSKPTPEETPEAIQARDERVRKVLNPVREAEQWAKIMEKTKDYAGSDALPRYEEFYLAAIEFHMTKNNRGALSEDDRKKATRAAADFGRYWRERGYFPTNGDSGAPNWFIMHRHILDHFNRFEATPDATSQGVVK